MNRPPAVFSYNDTFIESRVGRFRRMKELMCDEFKIKFQVNAISQHALVIQIGTRMDLTTIC